MTTRTMFTRSLGGTFEISHGGLRFRAEWDIDTDGHDPLNLRVASGHQLAEVCAHILMEETSREGLDRAYFGNRDPMPAAPTPDPWKGITPPMAAEALHASLHVLHRLAMANKIDAATALDEAANSPARDEIEEALAGCAAILDRLCPGWGATKAPHEG